MATLTDVPEPPPTPPRNWRDQPDPEPQQLRDLYDAKQREGKKK